MSWSGVHRWLAIALVALLVVWSITGALFHSKPGWERAYDQLSAERPAAKLDLAAAAPIASVSSALGGADIARLELFDSALGPLYRARTATGGSQLFDATTARRRSPLGADYAGALAVDAVSRSPHRGAYGQVARVETDADTIRIHFTSGTIVEVGRHDARVSQRGPDTDRIDWLYRIHYLQWTGHRGVDRVLALLGLALIWAVMIPGIVLFVRRFRR